MKKILLLSCAFAALTFMACDRTRIGEPSPYQTDGNSAQRSFVISGNYLFLVNQHALQGYDISASGGVLIKAGSIALHAAADTLYALSSGQLAVAMRGKNIQRYSASQQPGLLASFQGWPRGTQLAATGNDLSVLFAHDSISLFLYDAGTATTDPSETVPRDTLLSAGSVFTGMVAKDNIVYASLSARLLVLGVTNHQYTKLVDIDLQPLPGERVEDISIAGNELVLRSNKQLFFFDLTTPQSPALLAKLTR